MANVTVFADGGYRFIDGVSQYSAGVAAQSGYAIERARLSAPLSLDQGFAAVEARLAQLGRPLTAVCGCELRASAPFTESGFASFNRQYVEGLDRWGLIRAGVNPVARTMVCPVHEPPDVPSLYAFSYTVPEQASAGSFIISGSGEAREGASSYRESIVRLGDTSTDAMREKMRFVMEQMADRLRALGFGWRDAISTQIYTVHDIGVLIRSEIVDRGAAPGGVEWHVSRPPVEHIEFEMDVRGAAREVVLW